LLEKYEADEYVDLEPDELIEMMDRNIELLTAEEPIVTSEVLAAFILVRYNY